MARFVTVALRDGVLRSGIWHFDNAMVVVAKYDRLLNPTLVELNAIKVWVQIQNLHPFLKSKKVACSIIGATLGMMLIIDRLSVVSMSTMVRVRIDLEVDA